MTPFRQICLVVVLVSIAVAVGAHASLATTTIGFEGFADSVSLTNQIPGLTFTNTTILTSGAVGGSLNEFDFPPHSGVNVAADDGPIMIVFGSPQASVGGFFTYNVQLTLTAFDAVNNLVDIEKSAFTENFVSSGKPPNELISLASAAGITSIVIQGDVAGGSFALDDLTFTPLPNQQVPAPETLLLLAAAITIGAAWKIDRRARTRR